MLSRLSKITENFELALSRLPVRSLAAPEGEEFDEEFTRRYLTAISESLDQLELFGIHFDRFTKPRTTLSVAYVSLNVSDQDGQRARKATPKPEAVAIEQWRSDERESGAMRVEHALSKHRLMLIRGEAGGGKTTLLRWLAITAARSRFTGELASLNGHVPFFIKLRFHAGERLPSPEEYLNDVDATRNLRDVMPRGWAFRQLQSGRALLLVDGIDEIVASQREQVRQWLADTIRQFPNVRVVVTSRR